jgi:hypothetical protein
MLHFQCPDIAQTVQTQDVPGRKKESAWSGDIFVIFLPSCAPGGAEPP